MSRSNAQSSLKGTFNRPDAFLFVLNDEEKPPPLNNLKISRGAHYNYTIPLARWPLGSRPYSILILACVLFLGRSAVIRFVFSVHASFKEKYFSIIAPDNTDLLLINFNSFFLGLAGGCWRVEKYPEIISALWMICPIVPDFTISGIFPLSLSRRCYVSRCFLPPSLLPIIRKRRFLESGRVVPFLLLRLFALSTARADQTYKLSFCFYIIFYILIIAVADE